MFKAMFNNVGLIDRIIRLSLGSLLLYLGLAVYGGSALGIGLALAGAVAVLTGMLGTCALYGLLGINTRNSDQPS
jgi:hypothetical protein